MKKIDFKNIKKGKITMTIIIGIMCFILLYVMFMQFKIVNETDITSLRTKRDSELREELETWQSRYEDTSNQLEQAKANLDEYKNKIDDSQAAAELLDKELKQAELNLGKTDVKGAGVVITLEDADVEVDAEDLIKLMNELKRAEAEAISVNGQRITNLTEFADVDSYVVVNGTRLSSPFTIQVIGNQKYLESGLTAKGGYVDTQISEGKKVSLAENNDITITKYDGNFEISEDIKIK